LGVQPRVRRQRRYGRAREIREFRPEGETPIFVCSQKEDNRVGPSPTNYAEQLFEEIAERRSLEPPRWRRSGRSEEIARWIEHYPAELYSGGEEHIGRVVFYHRLRRGELRVFWPE
jgi:hypothetical protein